MKQLLAFAICIIAGCGVLNGTDGSERDCGFVAEIEQSEGKKEVEFVFYRVLTEVLDDKVNCGFGFAPVKVEKPTYRGEPLNEIEKTGIPTYVARGPIDTNEPIIAFESDGVGYIQDPSSVERTGSRMRVKMRRIPPK